MTLFRPALHATLVLASLALGGPAGAQSTAPAKATAATKKPAARPARKAAAKPVVPAPLPELDLPEAPADQISAAERVYYGVYDCEFNQKIDIVANTKHFGYVDVKHGKTDYVMKPVVSSTGAIRLEDVRGDTLMVQISSKSMLLNVKTAQRVVDDCVSPKQRELIELARATKAAEAASAAADGASAPVVSSAPLLK